MKQLKYFLSMCALAIVGTMMVGCSSSDDDSDASGMQTETDNPIENSSMRNTPLTLEAIEDGVITFANYSSGSVSYRINDGEMKSITSRTTSEIPVKAKDKVVFLADNATYRPKSDKDPDSNITCNVDCYIYGNIMSLINSKDYATTTTLNGDYAFCNLFSGARIKNHPTHLLLLPATNLTKGCYLSMFLDCTGLTKTPELPATQLEESCYTGMFKGCISLIDAPKLPATTLASSCYWSMFYNCTSLTKTPELPATQLEESCYRGMFGGCTSLSKAPELPAMVLSRSCYASMFIGCSNLKEAPKLPAKTLASSCYWCMFSNCTSLTKAPELPATTLTSLCYCAMFMGCSNLTEAPVLPATTLTESCYSDMFKDCIKLNSVTCLATEIKHNEYLCTRSWLDGVSNTGIFKKAPSMNNWPRNVDGIPSGWTIVDAN